MHIAVIGGSGFIGTKLISYLLGDKKISSVKNLDTAQSDLHSELTKIVDVLDTKSLQQELKGIDLVVLLAAEHTDDVSPHSLYYKVNVEGMRSTLQAMQANGVSRLIFTSTVAIYGLDKDRPSEDSPADPFNHYAKSKWQAEGVLKAWQREHADWNINIIRPSVIFGEGNRGNVYNLLRQISSGKFVMIGKGDNKKSMSYVGNVVAFIHFLMYHKPKGVNIYNYADKPDLTTNQIVQHASAVLSRKLPSWRIPFSLGMLVGHGFDLLAIVLRKKLSISSVRVKKFCAVTTYDSTRAMSTGFTPPYSLEQGLERMLEEEFRVNNLSDSMSELIYTKN